MKGGKAFGLSVASFISKKRVTKYRGKVLGHNQEISLGIVRLEGLYSELVREDKIYRKANYEFSQASCRETILQEEHREPQLVWLQEEYERRENSTSVIKAKAKLDAYQNMR